MRLIIGISEVTPGWKIVLEQIGVPCEKVDIDQPISADAFVVLIVTHFEKKQDTIHIREYLQNGGSVLIDASAAKNLLSQNVKRMYLKTLYVDEGPLFSQSIDCDLFQWTQVLKTANHCRNQKGKPVIGVLSYDKGNVVILPSGLIKSLHYAKARHKYVHSDYGERLPSEKVSKVSKGALRHIVQDSLIYLYHRRGIPFVHLWQYPKGEKNVFSFRVDTDFGTRQEIEVLYSLCREYHIQATWFVETKSQKNWVRFYRDMKDQEIGYHCYRHRIFSDYQTNKENIVEGLNILRNAGIHPKGYAAPFGEWNPVLGKVVQEMQFEYSSEFELDYDDLPFYPYLEGSFSTVLQVPIHPVSIGNLRRARHTKQQYLSYYQSVIRQKLILGDPIFIYHHPGHQGLDVFQEIFREIRQQNIPSMSMGDYSAWWKQRACIDWIPMYKDKKLVLDVRNGDTSVYLRAIFPDKKYAIFPFEKTVDTDRLVRKNRDRSSPVYSSGMRKQDSWRLWIYRMEHIFGKMKS